MNETCIERRGRAFYEDPCGACLIPGKSAFGGVSPNEVMEGPSFWLVLGGVRDKRVVDLGCGDGTLARADARRRVGSESSIWMSRADDEFR